ncbi:lysyl-tRNA synthetase class I [Chryseobacterium defluvii]|uniref:Lysyl-tRNA synthetase class I n=1 Tax=Chryseobacterium defluvii TaxID=160396 RepID=A0A840KE54_9FLAO|nr:lysyl-tRNA synthetase class I [Chryseobacterium defluvii]
MQKKFHKVMENLGFTKMIIQEYNYYQFNIFSEIYKTNLSPHKVFKTWLSIF